MPPAARAFGRVAASLPAVGTEAGRRVRSMLSSRPPRSRTGLPLYTTNPDHYAGIDDLELVAVPVPGVGE